MAEESVTVRIEGLDAGAKAVLQNLQREIAKLGLSGAAAGNAIAAGLQAGIAKVLEMSRTVDVASKADVAALRASSAAIRELSVAFGVAPAEIQKLAVAEQVLDTRLRQTTQSAKLQAQALVGTGAGFTSISPKARTAANAFTSVAFAASGMTNGLQGGVIAAGTLAASLATMSTSAAVAASASGIGALLVVLGAIIALMSRASAAAIDFSGTMDLIRSVSGSAEAAAISQAIDAQLNSAKAKLAAFKKEKPFAVLAPERKQLEAEIEGLTKASVDAFRAYANTLGQEGQRAGEKATAEAERRAQQAIRDAERHAEQIRDAERSAVRDQESLANEAVQLRLRSTDEIEKAELAAAVATRSRRRAEVNESLASEQNKTASLLAIDEAYHAQLDAIRSAAAERTRRDTIEEFNLRRQTLASDLSNQRADIEERAAQGLISQRDAEREIAAIERARIPALQQLAAEMLAFAEATKDPALLLAAQNLSAQIGSLGIERSLNRAAVAAVNFKDDAIEAVSGDLAQFLGSGINQVESFGDAWRSLALAAVQSIQQIIAQLIALRAAQVLTGFLSFGARGIGELSPSAGSQFASPGVPSLGPMKLAPSMSLPSLSLRDFSALQLPTFTGAPRPSASFGPSGGGDGKLVIELAPGLVAKEMSGPVGRKIHIKHAAENPKTINRALGRG